MHHLASSYTNLGRRTESLQLNQETFALRKATLGPDHPDTLLSMNNLAKSYDELGRHAEAAELFEKTLALEQATLGSEHINTLRCMANLAGSYNELGRHAEALQLRVDTLATVKATLGPDHPFTLACMHNLGVSYQRLDRHAEAAALLEETLTLKIARMGPDHPGTLLCLDVLAGSYAALGRHVTSATLHQHVFSLVPELFGAATGAYCYNAACAATLAGCESGGGEPELNELERSRWREQARSWLSEDLKYWTGLSHSSRLDDLRQAAATLAYWQTDPDLAGLREAARIAQLSDQERASCEQLWARVNSLLTLVQEAINRHPSSASADGGQD
jgi:tetratricopeptide (TPR) repeat protein